MNDDDSAATRQARTSRGDRLLAGTARDLSELARDLDTEPGGDAVMHRIVAAAVAEIGGASGAAITLFSRGRVTSPAHSDDNARSVGKAQETTQQGPCVDTARDQVTLRSDDLAADGRWPDWGRIAAGHGVRSVMSFQLFVQEDSMGALDVYGDHVDAFDDDAENTGLLLASHAAIALSAARKVENLRVALTSRDVIGQAKGVLMERYKIDPVAAFDLLVASSHRTHRRLSDVAEELTRTGDLPTRSGDRRPTPGD